MNWKRMSLFPFPKIFVSTFILRIDVEPETSKRRGNFLLQHETREMGEMLLVTAVIQIRVWTRIQNRHPDLIAFVQVQRRLEGQRTSLINGADMFMNKTRPD